MTVKVLSRGDQKMGIQKVSLDSVHLKNLGSELANIGSDFNQLLKLRKSLDARALQNSKASRNNTRRPAAEEKVQYKCKICAYQTDSSETFKIHVKKKHGLNIVSKEEEQNNNTEAQRKSIPCKFCSYKTSNKQHLVEHIKGKHKDILEKHRSAKPKQVNTSVATKKVPEKNLPDLGKRRSSREKTIDGNDTKIPIRLPVRREKLKELQYSGNMQNIRNEGSSPKRASERKAKHNSDTSDFESPVKSSNGSHVLEDILAEFHRIETDNSIFNSESSEFSKNLDLSLQEDIAPVSKKSSPDKKSPAKSKTSRRISSTQSRRRESSDVEITEVKDKKEDNSGDGKDKSAEVVDLSDSEDEGKKEKDGEDSDKEKAGSDSEREESSKEDKEDKDEDDDDDDDDDEEDDEEARLEYLKAKESYRKLKLANDLAAEVSEDLTERSEQVTNSSNDSSEKTQEISADKNALDSVEKHAKKSREADSGIESENITENETNTKAKSLADEKQGTPAQPEIKPEPKSAEDIQSDLISSLMKDDDSSEDDDDLDVDDIDALQEQMGGGLAIKGTNAQEQASQDKKEGTVEEQKKEENKKNEISESGISVIDVEGKKTELLTDEKINNIVSETDDKHHTQCTATHVDPKSGIKIEDLTGSKNSELDTAWEEMLDSMWDKPPTGTDFDISESMQNKDIMDANNNVVSLKSAVNDLNDLGIDVTEDDKTTNKKNHVDATWENMVEDDNTENTNNRANESDKSDIKSKNRKHSKKKGDKAYFDDTSDFDSDFESKLKEAKDKSKPISSVGNDSDDDNIDAAWENMLQDLEDRSNQSDTEPAVKSTDNSKPQYRRKDKVPIKPLKRDSPYLSTKDLVGEKLNSIFNNDERSEDGFGVDTTGERMLERMLSDMNKKERTDTVTEKILENSRNFDLISQVHTNPTEKPKKRPYNRKEDTNSKNKRLKQLTLEQTNNISKDTNIGTPKTITDKSNEKKSQDTVDNKDKGPNEDVYKQLQSSITDSETPDNNTPETTEDLNNELLALMTEGPGKGDQDTAEDLNEDFLNKMPEGSNNDADEQMIDDGKCPKCDFVSKCRIKAQAKQNLKLHIKAVHDKIKDIKCDRCDYKTAQRSNLTIHLRVHKKDGSQTAEDYFKEKAEDAAKESSGETSKAGTDKPQEKVAEKIDFRRQRGRPYASASNSMIKLSEINNTPKDIEKRMKQQLDEKKGPASSTATSTSNNKPTLQPTPAPTTETTAVKKEDEKKKEEEEDVLEKEYTVTIGNEEVKIQEWKNKIKIQTKNEVLRKQFEAELQKARQKNKGK